MHPLIKNKPTDIRYDGQEVARKMPERGLTDVAARPPKHHQVPGLFHPQQRAHHCYGVG
jgi:hypothetical protein